MFIVRFLEPDLRASLIIFLSDGVEHCYGFLIVVITAEQKIMDENLSPTAIQQSILLEYWLPMKN